MTPLSRNEEDIARILKFCNENNLTHTTFVGDVFNNKVKVNNKEDIYNLITSDMPRNFLINFAFHNL